MAWYLVLQRFKLVFHRDGKHLFEPYFKRRGICSQLITSKVENNSVRLVPRFLENKHFCVFSDDYNVTNPKLAPNSSSDVKFIEMTPYPGVSGTGPFTTIRCGYGTDALRCHFFSIGTSRMKTFIKNQSWSANSGLYEQLLVRTHQTDACESACLYCT